MGCPQHVHARAIENLFDSVELGFCASCRSCDIKTAGPSSLMMEPGAADVMTRVPRGEVMAASPAAVLRKRRS